ncbi:DUF177 domain-containing protein [Actinomyces sp. 2119]|nr:DUF177 domain-containing protein [Actinomyces sp. 2119]
MPGTVPGSEGLVVDITDLPQASGSVRTLQVRTSAPADLGTDIIGVPRGSSLSLEVALTSVEEGVLARASAELHVHGQCVRCLADLDEDRTITFDELYLTPEAVLARAAQGDQEAEEMLTVEGTSLDLEPALRDALALELPFRPLCRPDCPGLCPQCGERLEDLPADHGHDVLDPRWAGLAGLLEELGASGGGPEDSREGDRGDRNGSLGRGREGDQAAREAPGIPRDGGQAGAQ